MQVKNPEIHIFNKTLVHSIICSKCDSQEEKLFKEEEAIEILKILGIIDNIEEYQMNTWLLKNGPRTFHYQIISLKK